jgi:glutathione S-transferase
MILYHSQPTGNSYKVRLLLSLLRVPYTAVDVDIFGGGNKTAAYRSIHPLGKAPALRLDDGVILTESNAILVYLATGTRYFPEARLTRAKVLQWMFFEQYSHLPYIGVARYWIALLKKRPSEPDLRMWHQHGNLALEVMDRYLAKNRWLVGDMFTIADIALYAYTHVAEEGEFDLSPFGSVRAWLERVQREEGYVPLMQRPPFVQKMEFERGEESEGSRART